MSENSVPAESPGKPSKFFTRRRALRYISALIAPTAVAAFAGAIIGFSSKEIADYFRESRAVDSKILTDELAEAMRIVNDSSEKDFPNSDIIQKHIDILMIKRKAFFNEEPKARIALRVEDLEDKRKSLQKKEEDDKKAAEEAKAAQDLLKKRQSEAKAAAKNEERLMRLVEKLSVY